MHDFFLLRISYCDFFQGVFCPKKVTAELFAELSNLNSGRIDHSHF